MVHAAAPGQALHGRKLHVTLLVAFLVCVALWTHARSSAPQHPLEADWDIEDDYDDASDSVEEPAASANDSLLAAAPITPTCNALRPRASPGHVTAFLIMVHSPDTLEGARILLEQIYDPSDYFLIHADQKLNATLVDSYQTSMSACSNVEFVPASDRVKIGWGDFSMIDAEIAMLKQALRTTVPWTNLLLVDGTTWPILNSGNRQRWLEHFATQLAKGGENRPPAPVCSWGDKGVKYQSDCWRTPARCLDEACTKMSDTPGNAPVRKGNQWMILTRDMVDFAIHGPDAQAWYAFFEKTAVPDEHYFVSIEYGQPGGPTGWLPTPMYVDWGPCKTYPVAHFVGHPCNLGKQDVPHILGSKAMFARKLTLNETELKAIMLGDEPVAVRLPLVNP
ncbi:hypothetical protein JCM21900_004090 [Sporobolomyces salmonicolor]